MNQKQLAEERSKSGVCIVCGKADDKISRGLCVTHWNRWDKQRKAMTAEQRAEFDKRLMADGYLLPSRQGRPAIDDDVFADVASEVLKHMAAKEAQGQLLPGDMAARLAAEMAVEAEAEADQAQNPKPSKSTGAKRSAKKKKPRQS